LSPIFSFFVLSIKITFSRHHVAVGKISLLLSRSAAYPWRINHGFGFACKRRKFPATFLLSPCIAAGVYPPGAQKVTITARYRRKRKGF
jgi:hypothetical protein